MLEILKNQMTWILIAGYMFLVGIGIGGGNKSDYLGLDDEAVKNILMGMRMSTRYCDTERLAIDYCIDKLEDSKHES